MIHSVACGSSRTVKFERAESQINSQRAAVEVVALSLLRAFDADSSFNELESISRRSWMTCKFTHVIVEVERCKLYALGDACVRKRSAALAFLRLCGGDVSV